MPGTIPIIQDGARKLANQCAIGNGAALLVIFNAVASDPSLATSAIKGVAWLFAFGLAAAFFSLFTSYTHETADAALAGREKYEADNIKKLDQLLSQMGWAFLISAGCFGVGLIAAINLIGT